MRSIHTIVLFVLTLTFSGVGLGLSPGLAHAESVQDIDRMIEDWRLSEAQAQIERLERERSADPNVMYLKARLAFMRGDYKTAKGLMQQALENGAEGPYLEEIQELIVNTHDVTKTYEKHTSPKGYFEIYVQPGKDRVLLPFAFEVLDRAYEELGKELGLRPKTPIRVEIYPETSVLARVSPLTEEEIRTSGTIALCKYNRLMITSPKALLKGYDWADTVVHEYVHYVIHAKTSHDSVPIWMHEGMAKFLERRWRGPEAHRLPPSSEHLLQQRVKQGKLITFEQMHPSMAKLPSQEDASLAFAEVYTVMEYLHDEVGQGAFAQVLDAINAGKDAPAAFAQVLQTDFPSFERKWRASLKKRPPIDFPEESGFVTKLQFEDETKETTDLRQIPQPKARGHMQLGQLLHARDRCKAAVVEYRKATRLMGNQHPIVQTRLAQCLLAIQKPQEAIEALERTVEVFPSYVETWLQLGTASVQLGQPQKALAYLREAAYLNPFHPEVHRQMALAYQKLGQNKKAATARNYAKMVN